MKQTEITAPIYGYNSHGLKHRAPIEVLVWIDKEIRASDLLADEFNRIAKDTDYSDYENEISRHEEEGFNRALTYVKRYLESRD